MNDFFRREMKWIISEQELYLSVSKMSSFCLMVRGLSVEGFSVVMVRYIVMNTKLTCSGNAPCRRNREIRCQRFYFI